jgi:hypothetical protein
MSLHHLTRKKSKPLYFTRSELSSILSAYSVRVASGEWRDYALDHINASAMFSIFKHAHEHPLLTIEKKLLKGQDKSQFILQDKNKILFKTTRLPELISYLHRLPRLIKG